MTSPPPTAPPITVEAPSDSGPEQSLRVTGQPVGRTFIALYVLAIIGLWIALLTPASVTLALRIAALDPENKASSLALVAGIGAIFSVVSNPVFGRLSDSCTSRWGRRRPFMVGGIVVGAAGLSVIGNAPSILVVLIGWCLAQLALGACLAALIAVLPDRVPEHRRGRVSGFMGMTNQVGTVIGTFLIQVTGTVGAAMFVIPALIGLVLVLSFVLYLREAPKTRAEVSPMSWSDVPRSLWINPVRFPDFSWAFLSRLLVWTGKAFFLTYKTYFLMDHFGYSAEEAAVILGWTMLILGVGIIVASNVAGWLSDLVQRRKVFILVASLIFATGMIVIAISPTVPTFLIGVGIASIGQGIYVGVDYALVASVLPNKDTEAAKGMGVFNISNALPQSIAPAIAPLILTIGGGGGENYTALYLVAGGFAIAGGIVIQFIRTAR